MPRTQKHLMQATLPRFCTLQIRDLEERCSGRTVHITDVRFTASKPNIDISNASFKSGPHAMTITFMQT